MRINLNETVIGFVQALNDGADDEHEFETMLGSAVRLLAQAHQSQAMANRELVAGLVLDRKATIQGVTVADLKALVADEIKEHPSKVSNVTALDTLVQRIETPKP